MEPIEYPGTLEVIRAVTVRLAPEGEWESSTGHRVQFAEIEWQPDGQRSPYYAFWALRSYSEDPKDPSGYATIAAFYSPIEGWTKLIFLDGLNPTRSLRKSRPMEGVLVNVHWALLTGVTRAAGRPLPQAEAQATTPDEGGGSKPKQGNPGLDREDVIYRVIKAQEGEEIKQRESDKTWKEIAREIGWRFGYDKSGVKLLEDARKRLKRADQALLAEVERRRKKKKEKKES